MYYRPTWFVHDIHIVIGQRDLVLVRVLAEGDVLDHLHDVALYRHVQFLHAHKLLVVGAHAAGAHDE